MVRGLAKKVAYFQKSRIVEKCPKRAKTVEKEGLLKNMLKKHVL